MCGRITRTSPREMIAKEFGVTRFTEVDWHLRYNVAPSQIVQGIISVDGEKRLGPMRSGAQIPLPYWTSSTAYLHFRQLTPLAVSRRCSCGPGGKVRTQHRTLQKVRSSGPRHFFPRPACLGQGLK